MFFDLMAAPELAGDRRRASEQSVQGNGRDRVAPHGRPFELAEGPTRILLVDDDEVDRLAVRRAFAAWSVVELVEVEDAGAALDALQREHFDCAIVDYCLPGKNDGLDVLRAARKLGVRTPVVVLTGRGDEETAVEMMKAGASDYIPKAAFSAERVSQSVKNAIRLRSAEEEIERAHAALRNSIAREQAARADAELQRERLRAAFLQAPALINVHRGPAHVFELVHPLTKELFGNRPLEGLALREALPELAGKGVFETYDRVFATGEPQFGREVHFRLEHRGPAQPRDAYFNFVYQPLRDTAGKVEGVLVVAVDVTDSVVARQRSEILLGDLHNAVRTREDLLAVVSHDLRNPLSVIVASARSLLRAAAPAADAARVGHVERIARAADRMSRLIEGLLDLAKIDSGTLSLSLERYQARDLAEESLEMMRPAAQRKGLRLENETQAAVSACCDKDRLHQILSNLVGNAIKFTPEGGTVSVRAFAENGETHFAVADSGQGIAKEDLPYIFDRYWQARAPKKPGIGLGLSIVKGLVEAHHGRVWAESDVGKGTTIHFVLPPARETALRSTPVGPEIDPKTVLVVDDDADTRTSVAQILQDQGYTVLVAGDGRQALDLLRRQSPRPGLILLDMMMPVMDGSAFRAEQERDPALSGIPVVVFSAFGNVARTAADLRAAGYLPKPLSTNALLETIARVSQRAAMPC